jgi:hypothetical protein
MEILASMELEPQYDPIFLTSRAFTEATMLSITDVRTRAFGITSAVNTLCGERSHLTDVGIVLRAANERSAEDVRFAEAPEDQLYHPAQALATGDDTQTIPKSELPLSTIIEATVENGQWHSLDLTEAAARDLQAPGRRREVRRSLGHTAAGLAVSAAGLVAARLVPGGSVEEVASALAAGGGGLWATGGVIYGGVKTYLRWERRNVVGNLQFMRLDVAGPQLPARDVRELEA